MVDKDFSRYEVDRALYDKNWFNFALIRRPKEEKDDMRITYFEYKIIDIDERGQVLEKKTFEHY